MDSLIDAVVGKLLEIGITEEFFLVVLFIGFLWAMFHRYFIPLDERVRELPDREFHTAQDAITTEKSEKLKERLILLEGMLKEIQSTLVNQDFDTKILTREMETINKEIQEIRSILSQLHGHMIYGNRSDYFGNREIR